MGIFVVIHITSEGKEHKLQCEVDKRQNFGQGKKTLWIKKTLEFGTRDIHM